MIPNRLPAFRSAIVVMSCLLALASGRVEAGPTPCTIGETAVVCSGDQSAGVISNIDFNPAGIDVLRVNNLTTDIRPSITAGGILWLAAPSTPSFMDLTAISTQFSIVTTSSTGVGIGVDSATTGAGQAGRDITVVDSIAVHTEAPSARAIDINTRAGDGGRGGFGGEGGGITFLMGAPITTQSHSSTAIILSTAAGNGGTGESGGIDGGKGGNGGNGGRSLSPARGRLFLCNSMIRQVWLQSPPPGMADAVMVRGSGAVATADTVARVDQSCSTRPVPASSRHRVPIRSGSRPKALPATAAVVGQGAPAPAATAAPVAEAAP